MSPPILKSKDPAYFRWHKIKRRCYNKTDPSYKCYGGRGIFVVDEWHIFENFKKWFWDNYIEGYSIDRINNDGPYSPSNCRFANALTQSRNSRKYTPARMKAIKQNRKLFAKSLIAKYGDPKTRTEKHCGACATFKNLNCFYKRKDTVDGLYNWCKECVSYKGKLNYRNRKI